MPAETGNLITTLIMIVNFSISLAKTGIFDSVSLRTAKNYLSYLHETPSHNAIPIWIMTRHLNLSLFLSSTNVIPCPPTPNVIRPRGRRPPGERQTSIRLKELGDRRWLAGGVQTRQCALGVQILSDRYGRPRAKSIYPRITITP